MDILFSPDLLIFSQIAGFVFVLMIFEVIMFLMGLSSDMGLTDADSDVGGDFGFDADVDVGDMGDFGLSASEIEMLDISPANEPVLKQTGARRFLDLIGITRGPLFIWLASIAAGVSIFGFLLQFLMMAVLGGPIPGGLALAIVVVPGILWGGAITRWVSRLVPAIETSAVCPQSYRGRQGVVIEGTARAGRSALVRWEDAHGTSHRLFVDVLRDEDVIPEGSEVLLLRDKDRNPRMISLSA